MLPTVNHSEAVRLAAKAVAGDDQAWESLLVEHRPRLRRMVALRLDRRLRGRVDPSDVIQESLIDAARRLPEYLRDPQVPFFVWLRGLTGQRLVDQHRRHLGARARDAGRDISLHQRAWPEATSAVLAAHLLGNLTSPSEAAIRVEQRLRLEEALSALEPIDREILALRHFEQLSNGDAAAALGIDKSTASKRYMRALTRLKDALALLPRSSFEAGR